MNYDTKRERSLNSILLLLMFVSLFPSILLRNRSHACVKAFEENWYNNLMKWRFFVYVCGCHTFWFCDFQSASCAAWQSFVTFFGYSFFNRNATYSDFDSTDGLKIENNVKEWYSSRENKRKMLAICDWHWPDIPHTMHDRRLKSIEIKKHFQFSKYQSSKHFSNRIKNDVYLCSSIC